MFADCRFVSTFAHPGTTLHRPSPHPLNVHPVTNLL